MQNGISNTKTASELGVSRSTVGRVLKEYRDGADWATEDVAVETEDESIKFQQPGIVNVATSDAQLLDIYHQSVGYDINVGDKCLVVDFAITGDLSTISAADEFTDDEGNITLPNSFVYTDDSYEPNDIRAYTDNANLIEILDGHELTVALSEMIEPLRKAAASIKYNGVSALVGLQCHCGEVSRKDAAEMFDVSTSSVGRCVGRVHAGLTSWFATEDVSAITEEYVSTKQAKGRAKRDNVKDLGEVMTKSAPYKFILDDKVIMLVRDGEPHTIDTDHPNFDTIYNALKEQRWDDAVDAIDIKASIERYSCGSITYDDGVLLLDGETPIDGRLGSRIIDMLTQGKDKSMVDRLAKFMEKMDANPSNQITSRIYDFLKFNDVTIDEDGDIIAFKVVSKDYKDLYTKKMDNSVGATVEVKRHRVDEDMNQTCSYGLHVCAIGYVSQYSGNPGSDRVVKVKMNPADVVAIPRDYGDAKVRCCKYIVLEDVTDAYLKGEIESMSVQHGGLYED